MRLRAATAADFGFIRSLTGNPDYAPFIGDDDEAQLQRWLDSPAARVLILDDGGGPEGFAIFREIGDPSGRVELFRIALDRAGAGRGDAFFAALLDYAFRDLGAARVWLDASAENARAIKVYRRAGCQREGVLRQHWWRPCLGRSVDLHMFAMSRAEWQARRLPT
ncbi:GNAT family N-acetyltransferase [Rhodobacter sp. Har01]|uniref:GNAT family N-acetyltransferase n=1 Tax=Rhodobacter sp. Har01 TaxID=2883999 RepID=UPI001D072DF8|nr:GNAT family protein [Rhodobacter sp. Har01]MCB6177315.1 GNAT family N-acetyltransferase [Rhodobacter sp. Har01]